MARLAASDPGEGDYFGRRLAVLSDLIISGSNNEKGGPNDPLPRAGAAYLFGRNQGGPNNWGEIIKLMVDDAEPNDLFGSSVALNSDGFIFVGASDGDVDTQPPVLDSGAAYIFNMDLEPSFSIYLPYLSKGSN